MKREIVSALLSILALIALAEPVFSRHRTSHAEPTAHRSTSSRASGTSRSSRLKSRASVKSTSRRHGRLQATPEPKPQSRSRRSKRRGRAYAEPAPVKSHQKRAKHAVVQHEEAKEPAKEEPVVQSSGFSKIYALYDQGLNARLVGNLGDAVNQLKKAARLVRMEPRPLGKPLTMEAMIDYELGQAAESDNNLPLAVESYEECLKADPHHIDASVRLSGTLLRAGQPLMALMKARDAVERNPQEPRAHAILAVTLEKNGFADDAKLERQKAQHLLKFKTQPEPRVPIIEESDRIPSSKEEDKSMDAEPNADAPKNVEETPAKNDAQSVAPLPGN